MEILKDQGIYGDLSSGAGEQQEPQGTEGGRRVRGGGWGKTGSLGHDVA